MAKGATEILAQFISQTTLAQVPASGQAKARDLIRDLLGVTARGARESAVKILGQVLPPGEDAGGVTLIGQAQRQDPLRAALVNGVAGHALDFDDTDQMMYGHPSVPVLPAALALAQSLEASGAALLEAYIIGVEVTTKLAYAMNPGHYRLGWHSTCTQGTMGAAAAAAKLLGLSGDKLHWALALAASQAGGLQQNFGTMGKPFHAGKAASNGVLAALLAAKGFTGDRAILEAPLGYFHLFCAGQPVAMDQMLTRLGKPFEVDDPGVQVKKHPSCAFTHPAVDAALTIASRPGFSLERVQEVTGTIHSLADQILIHRQPRTGLEAKFSLEACLALALGRGKLSLEAFEDAALSQPAVARLLSRTQRQVQDPPGGVTDDFGPATVQVRFVDGEQDQARVDKARGTPANPMSQAELLEKYRDCCGPVLDPDQVERSLAMLEDLAGLPSVGRLMDCYQTAA